jgi:hypothetical protein
MRRLLKRVLTPPLVVVAALLMLIEETLILGLQRLMAGLANLPWVAAVEARMARLPPYPAMVLFLLPALILLPVKLGAVWMIARGKFALGAGIIVAGKVIGTALAARVYKILHPTLATLPWFVRAEAWVFGWRDRLYAAVKAMPAWKAASVAVHATRAWVVARVETLRRRIVRPGWMARRLAAIRRRARRSA